MYGGLRFGLQDESARLNINALTVIEENWSGLSPLVASAGADARGSDLRQHRRVAAAGFAGHDRGRRQRDHGLAGRRR